MKPCCRAAAGAYRPDDEAEPASPLFRCPACGLVQLFPPRIVEAVSIVRAGRKLHKSTCRHAPKGAPRCWAGTNVADLLARVLLVPKAPQPCLACLGREVVTYLGVSR